MIAPSPAPRPPRHLRWPWVAGGLSLMVVGAVAAVAVYPQWAGPTVHDELVARASARMGTPVQIDELELAYDRVTLHGVRLHEGESVVEFDTVVVDLDRAALRRARLDPAVVAIRGGRISGDASDLERIARRLTDVGGERATTSEEGSWLRRRIGMRPASAQLDGVALDVTQGGRHVVGELSATASLAEESATLSLARASLEVEGRLVRATRVSSRLARGEDGLEFPVRVEVEGASTALTPQLSVAGVVGHVELRDADLGELALDLAGGFSDQAGEAQSPAPKTAGELWSISGELRRDMSRGEVVVEMAAFELGRVPRVLAELPVVDSEAATVGGRMELRFADGRVHAAGNLEIAGVNISDPLIAHDVVRGVGFSAELEATIDPALRSVDLERLELRRRGISLLVRGSVVHPASRVDRRYDLRFTVPPVPCQAVLEAIPVELVPALTGFVLEGDFHAEVVARIDYAKLDELELSGEVALAGCRAVAVPESMTAARLDGAFTHRVRMRDGRQRAVQLWPGSGSFTSISAISPNVVAAVQTTEDGGFWHHRGFLPSQFEEALRRNLAAGEVRLGASTITMQMVKNVFLSHERTLSRKLQEMFLTWYVEETISKDRIMEIYLNVVEFGPAIYGVTNAAHHYFGRSPAELTSLEAAYLALMLPSPVRRHVHYCHQRLSPAFAAKLRRIHGLMRSRGRIDEVEYATWKDLELVFDPRDRGSEEQCLAEVGALRAAKGGQLALSGLLGGSAATWMPVDDDIDVAEPLEDEDLDAEPLALPDVDAGDEFDTHGLGVGDPAAADAPGVPAMDRDDPSVDDE